MTFRPLLILMAISAWALSVTAQPPVAPSDTGVVAVDTAATVDSLRIAQTDTSISAGQTASDGIPQVAFIILGILLIGGGVAAWRFLFIPDTPENKAETKPARGHPVSLDGDRLIIGNAQDIGRRQEQQDAFGFSDTESASAKKQGLLAVVADGMGGMAHGSEAGRNAVHTFLNAFAAQDHSEDIPAGLYGALMQAQSAVRGLAASTGMQENIGTTLIATVVHQGMLYWISVGDSHIYLMRNQRLVQLNADHNYHLDLLRERAAGLVNCEDIESDPDRHALTSFLGIEELDHIDRNIRPFPLQNDDRILLCSDGLYGVLSESEIMNTLKDDPQDACESLIAQTIGKDFEQQDNVTAVAIVCEQVGEKEQNP